MTEQKSLSLGRLKLLAGTDPDPANELRLLRSIKPADLLMVCELLVAQKQSLREEHKKEREERRRMEKALQELRSPPLHPATVLRSCGDRRLDLLIADRRHIVGIAPEIEAEAIKPGDEVLLNGDLTAVIAHNNDVQRTGLVGTVADTSGGRIVIRGSADDELVAMCAPDLADSLVAGDRVVLTQGVPCVIDRLPDRGASGYELRRPPAVTFDDIGGLDDVIGRIRDDLDLQLRYRDEVVGYKLRPGGGIILVGPPGIGKSMVARAVANYLSTSGTETHLLHVEPGALRSMWYGQSEAKVRELFAFAKAAPGLVVMFFDELDSFGARGVGIGQDIDGRVMGSLLSAIQGIDSADNIFCVCATNRLDLCDSALIRDGRLGDSIYHLRRPGREATRQILSKYLVDDLPYASEKEGCGGAVPLIEAATSYLHAPQGGAQTIATVTLRDGSQQEIHPREVLSGALLAGVVERAKRVAAHRHLEGGTGIQLEDVLAALDEALTSEARKLAAPHVASQTLIIPRAEEIVRVELPPERRVQRHRYLRAA